MGRLRFSFGTMSSGKLTLALQIHHNLSATSTGLLCSMHDRAGAHVSSALGVSTPAVEVHPTLVSSTGYEPPNSAWRVGLLWCDEAQFYTDAQVEQLAQVVDELDVDVYAFGLLTDFRGKLFPGSACSKSQMNASNFKYRLAAGVGRPLLTTRLHDGVQICMTAMSCSLTMAQQLK